MLKSLLSWGPRGGVLCAVVWCAGCWDFNALKQPRGDGGDDDMAVVVDDLGAVDLAGADLSGADLVLIDQAMPIADLAGADLRGADLVTTPIPDMTPSCNLPNVGSAPIRYVRSAAAPGNNGLSPSTPMRTIQAAIDSLGNGGGAIFIAKGNYTESLVHPAGRSAINFYGEFNQQFDCRMLDTVIGTQVISEAGRAALVAESNVSVNEIALIGTNGNPGDGERAVAFAADGKSGSGLTLSFVHASLIAKPMTSTPFATGADIRNARVTMADTRIDVSNGESSFGVRACGVWLTTLRTAIAVDADQDAAWGIQNTFNGCMPAMPPAGSMPAQIDLTTSVINVKGGGAYGVEMTAPNAGGAQANTRLSSSSIVSRAVQDSIAIYLLTNMQSLTLVSSTLSTLSTLQMMNGPVVRSNAGTLSISARDSILDGGYLIDTTNAPAFFVPTPSTNLYWTSELMPGDMASQGMPDKLAVRVGGTPTLSLATFRTTLDGSSLIADPQFTDFPPAVHASSPARDGAPTPNASMGCNGVVYSFFGQNRPTGGICDIGAYEQ